MILNFNQFCSLNEGSDHGQLPRQHFILDGASSAGKSSALTSLDNGWCVLAVDSFYNVMFEELGEEDFGNGDKPTISEIYPDCPYQHDGPESEGWESAARWYMAQEAQWGKIWQNGLVDATGKKFGKPKDQHKIIYDDVQGDVLQMFPAGNRPKWILIHAPIDHTIKNVQRRGDRPLDGVLKNSYCFKYEARPKQGGVDPSKSWTADEIKELLSGENWVNEFLTRLGITDDREYWIWAKKPAQGNYDLVINTRGEDGGQKSIDEIGAEAAKFFG